METNQQQGKFGRWIKTSITARMLMVGFLILILLIPLSFIKSLINERMHRQQDVVNEINKKWGQELVLYGPILRVPYKTVFKKSIVNQKNKQVQTEMIEEINYAYFFPKELNITSTINPEEKKRSIYKTAVYKSKINISGNFTKPDFSEVDIKPNQILWKKAKLIVQTSNLKGVNDVVAIKLQNSTYPLTAKYQSSNNYYNKEVKLHKLESKYLKSSDLPIKKDMDFSLQLNVNGSKQIRFIPIGKETNAHITSNWKDANFFGEYLPYNKNKITDKGFDAKWKVLDINRPFSQQSFNQLPALTKYAFGVNFMIPVDEYQKSERSAKYGFLVIGLTFLIFFLIQTMSKISIHPFQYLMIGIALTMFYTLLISISEHSSFLKAYIIAGTAVVALIALYSKTILKGIKFPLFIAISLIVLYAFIFIIIQLESYALLVGSIGLFLILSIVMFASRKIDWQNG